MRVFLLLLLLPCLLYVLCDTVSQTFQIASVEAIAQLLQEWDISQTEMLLNKLEQAKEQRLEEERKRKEAETSRYGGLAQQTFQCVAKA